MCMEMHALLKKWVKSFKEGQNVIQNEDRLGRSTIKSTWKGEFSYFGWMKSYNRGQFWTTGYFHGKSTQNCVWWPFLRSVVIGFQKVWYHCTNRGKSCCWDDCYIFLKIKIWPLLISNCLETNLKEFLQGTNLSSNTEVKLKTWSKS